MIKNVRAPYGEVGKLESSWYPLVLDQNGRAVDPETDENCGIDLPEIESPKVCKLVRCLSIPIALACAPSTPFASATMKHRDAARPRRGYHSSAGRVLRCLTR